MQPHSKITQLILVIWARDFSELRFIEFFSYTVEQMGSSFICLLGVKKKLWKKQRMTGVMKWCLAIFEDAKRNFMIYNMFFRRQIRTWNRQFWAHKRSQHHCNEIFWIHWCPNRLFCDNQLMKTRELILKHFTWSVILLEMNLNSINRYSHEITAEVKNKW